MNALHNLVRLYLIIDVKSEDEQTQVLQLVKQKLPSFTELHKLLFYTTEVGKVAIVRQIKPYIHIETEMKTFNTLYPHITYTLLLSNDSHYAELFKSEEYRNDMKAVSKHTKHVIQRVDELLTMRLQ